MEIKSPIGPNGGDRKHYGWAVRLKHLKSAEKGGFNLCTYQLHAIRINNAEMHCNEQK